MNKSKYPDTFFRVTVKGIIRDRRGFVLAVKEYDSDAWSLPGGGMEHLETFEQALARELYEEALVDQDFTPTIIGVDSFFVESKQAYLMWIIAEVTFIGEVTYGIGADAHAVEFIDPKLYQYSRHRPERLIYKWCAKKDNVMGLHRRR